MNHWFSVDERSDPAAAVEWYNGRMQRERDGAGRIEAELLREGDYWTVRFEQRELRVRDAKGMLYLAELLARPGVEIAALELAGARPADRAGAVEQLQAGLGLSGEGDLGPTVDANAKAAYKRRLEELRSEQAEAEAFHDPERAARARAEHERIVDELASAIGLGGRDRRAGSPAERARLNVTRAIKNAVAHIQQHDRALGELLAITVLTGRSCVYRPERGARPVRWSVVTRSRPPLPSSRFEPPETQYVDSDGVHIAYQVLGEGEPDIVAVPGLISHLDVWWEDQTTARFYRRLASLGRLIMFDKRDTGLSDSDPRDAPLEQRMADIQAVMTACGSNSAALFGYSEGGTMSLLFAATYPERVTSLVLTATAARWPAAPDYPCGRQSEQMLSALEAIATHRWGRGDTIDWYAPSIAGSVRARERIARWERMAASPSAFLRMLHMIRDIDLRNALPTIHVPALVIQRTDDRIAPPCHGRYLAEHLPDARYLEQPGDHLLWAGDSDAMLGEIEEFLASTRTAAT